MISGLSSSGVQSSAPLLAFARGSCRVAGRGKVTRADASARDIRFGCASATLQPYALSTTTTHRFDSLLAVNLTSRQNALVAFACFPTSVCVKIPHQGPESGTKDSKQPRV